MKKLKLHKVLSLLFVLCMATSCFAGHTLANYSNTTSKADNARIATWGFGTTSSISITNLFSSSYTNVESNSPSEDVIAPGTSGSQTIKLSYADSAGKGAPEVAYTVKLAIDTVETSIGANIKSNSAIQWSFNDSSFGTWDTMLSEINSYTEDVAAGNLPNIQKTGINIAWRWDFNEGNATNSATDNALGGSGSPENVKLTIQFSATQID